MAASSADRRSNAFLIYISEAETFEPILVHQFLRACPGIDGIREKIDESALYFAHYRLWGSSDCKEHSFSERSPRGNFESCSNSLGSAAGVWWRKCLLELGPCGTWPAARAIQRFLARLCLVIMTVTESLQKLRVEWATSRVAEHRGKQCPFRLTCSFAEGDEDGAALKHLPAQLVEFWKNTSAARLFEDEDSGQWGLEIVSPGEARLLTEVEVKKRPRDYVYGDLVIGRFLGDSDLLLVRCDPSAFDYGL